MTKKTRTFFPVGLSFKRVIFVVVAFVLFFISALPLLIYPFVLLANIMALGGSWEVDFSFIKFLIVVPFFLTSTLYPLVYTWTLFYFFSNKPFKLWKAFLPLFYLLLVLFLFFLWNVLEKF